MLRIKRLEGMLPICASCKDVRDDLGVWHPIESYVSDHSEAAFTHGLCPGCADQLLDEAGVTPATPGSS
jgi:hypothetical protein